MTGFKSKKAAALDEEGMYLVHHTAQQDATMQSLKDLKRSVCDEVGKAAFAQPAQEPVKYKCTVIDDQHPQGIPLEQWGNTGKAQPAQEPVVWMGYDRGLKMFTAHQRIADAYPEIYTVPLYPSLPQRPWVDLSDEEISDIAINNSPMVHEFARAVLAKSKEKNNG